MIVCALHLSARLLVGHFLEGQSIIAGTHQHFFVNAFVFPLADRLGIMSAIWTYHDGYSYVDVSIWIYFEKVAQQFQGKTNIPVEVMNLGMLHSFHLIICHDGGMVSR